MKHFHRYPSSTLFRSCLIFFFVFFFRFLLFRYVINAKVRKTVEMKLRNNNKNKNEMNAKNMYGSDTVIRHWITLRFAFIRPFVFIFCLSVQFIVKAIRIPDEIVNMYNSIVQKAVIFMQTSQTPSHLNA